MPDNGLANLAGALLCAGHETLILDFGTVENVAAMFPAELVPSARSAFASAMERLSAGEGLTEENMRLLSAVEARMEEASENRCHEIAEELCERIEKLKPDFIGFKLWNGDGFSGSIDIAKAVRSRCKNVKVFAGGPHVDVFREHIYRATDVFDALVYGEGEETIVQLAEFVRGKRKMDDVDNVIFKRNGKAVTTPCRRIEDLSALPFPCYSESVYPAMRNDSKIKVIVLDESRGCPFGCYFCIHPIKSGWKLRTKPAERVIEEMCRIMEEVGTRAFRYAGSTTPSELAGRIARAILERRMEVVYSSFGNAANASADCYPEMRRSGCRSIFFGIESGSEEILRRSMGKKIKPGRIAEVIEGSKKAGIFTVGSIIFPSPFETEETERVTMEFLREVRPDSVVVLFPILYPGTEWVVNPDRFGFSFDKEEYADRAMHFKAKPLLPMEFWDELPFSMNGRNFRAIRSEAARFAWQLEAKGILTSVSDDLALMAKLAGYEGKERDFRNLTQAAFFCGDVDRIREVVATVNKAAGSERAESAQARTVESA
jgi:radical SAM superfamily enzyme YgiQ (UPF0313 family)